MRKLKLIGILSLFMLFVTPMISWALPTIHDIYVATQRGDYNGADSMIKEVLRANPNSAKAHWVYANVLYQENKLDQAKAEFQKAESLSPSDSFANAQAVQALRGELYPPVYANTNHNGLIFLVCVVVIVGIVGMIFLFRRREETPEGPSPRAGAASGRPYMSSAPGSPGSYRPSAYLGPNPAPSQGGGTTVINNNQGGGGSGLLTGVLVGEALAGGNRDREVIVEHERDDNRDFGTKSGTESAPESAPAPEPSTGADFGTSSSDSSSSDSKDFGTDSGSSSSDDFGTSGSDSGSDFGSGGSDSGGGGNDFGSGGGDGGSSGSNDW